MVKNTDKEYRVVDRHLGKMVALITGISFSSLFLALMPVVNHQRNENSDGVIASSNSARDEYYKIYKEIYRSLDMSLFDSKFIDLYQNGTIIINGEERKLESLRLRCTDTGVVHFVLSGDNHTDVYTGESFHDKIVFVCPFRDSKMFYQMYKDGLFNSNQLNISREVMMKYVDGWNMEKHTEIPRLKAEEETNEIYRKRVK